ncbi:hypothetical protein EJ08DRAFT_308774 [Tothia fuscella]|uniref:Uncharacterized protein n=1 Tax=Tothia fuscella TaxID=1048955 RepID=A0A9P4NPI5_9PEZI|nr:hypothetical protein EJ08DRAFT_308774 [Tothia fuscella]
MSRGAEHVYPSVEHSPSHHHARRLSSLQFSDPTQTLQFHAVHPADNDQFRYAYHGQSARTAPSPPEYMPNQRPGYLVGYLREPPLRGHLAAPTRADYDVVDLTSSPRSMRHAPPARVRSPPRFTIVNSPVEPSGYGVEARGPASHERARPLFQGSEPRPQVEMDNRPVLRQEAPPRGVNQNRSSFSQVALPSRASRLAPAFGVPGFGGSMSVNSHNYRDSPLPPPPVAYHAAHPPTESWVQFNGTRSQPVK